MQILILIKPSVDEFFKFKNPNKHVCFARRPKSTCKHACAFIKKTCFYLFYFFSSSSQINSLSRRIQLWLRRYCKEIENKIKEKKMYGKILFYQTIYFRVKKSGGRFDFVVCKTRLCFRL